MLKVLMLMQCRSEVSVADFAAFRRSELPTAFIPWRACHRYVQYDLHPEPRQLASPPPLELSLDAIDELWLDESACDSAANALSLFEQRLEASQIQRVVGEMKVYLFEEREVKQLAPNASASTPSLKRLVPLARKTGTTHAQFMQHWNTVHAPLLLAVRPGPLRYSQLCVVRELRLPSGVGRLAADIDGFSESWFMDESAMNAGRNTPEGVALMNDNALYVERSKRIFFDERELYYRAPD